MHFLLHYCTSTLPQRFDAPAYSALLAAYVQQLPSYSPTVSTELSRSLLVPLLKQLADRDILQDVMEPKLLDALFKAIEELQTSVRMQSMMSNVRCWLHMLGLLALFSHGSHLDTCK